MHTGTYPRETMVAEKFHAMASLGDANGPDRLEDIGEELRRFLGPVCDSLIEKRPFTHTWPAGGPWRLGEQAPTEGEGR
ncbi:MAG: hypothetical protein F4Z04_04685 [Acidobacteria bacterium]|nr:hypothetical protein [Acidobacteriota bacterium]